MWYIVLEILDSRVSGLTQGKKIEDSSARSGSYSPSVIVKNQYQLNWWL